MARLPQNLLLKVHAAAVEASLDRDTLLGGLDRSFVSALIRVESPSAQLLKDLHELNQTELLVDGSTPLAIWLTNAESLAAGRREAAVFRDAHALLQLAVSDGAKEDNGNDVQASRERASVQSPDKPLPAAGPLEARVGTKRFAVRFLVPGALVVIASVVFAVAIFKAISPQDTSPAPVAASSLSVAPIGPSSTEVSATAVASNSGNFTAPPPLATPLGSSSATVHIAAPTASAAKIEDDCQAVPRGGPQVWSLRCICGGKERGEPSLPVSLEPQEGEDSSHRAQRLVSKLKDRGWTCP